MSPVIPPIKSQGIKTKLVPLINDLILRSGVPLKARWFEPFFGTGVVGFNSPLCGTHIAGDTNPHLIRFYQAIQNNEITVHTMRAYLEAESRSLQSAAEDGYVHFRVVRDRFNAEHNPYDFLFLSRAGFNGMMRFNRSGDWNIPFCKKPDRFAPAYVTKICNQVGRVAQIIGSKTWEFHNVPFGEIIGRAEAGDLIYCDPPYFGRYVDYYNGWTERDEQALFDALSATPARFILSTWHHNDYRENEMIPRYWSRFNVVTKDHFYHNGGRLENRRSVVEALVFNFDLQAKTEIAAPPHQLHLFTEAS